jgi:hypothetical protein
MDLQKVILSYSYLRLLLLLTFIYCGSTQASESISAFKRIEKSVSFDLERVPRTLRDQECTGNKMGFSLSTINASTTMLVLRYFQIVVGITFRNAGDRNRRKLSSLLRCGNVSKALGRPRACTVIS